MKMQINTLRGLACLRMPLFACIAGLVYVLPGQSVTNPPAPAR